MPSAPAQYKKWLDTVHEAAIDKLPESKLKYPEVTAKIQEVAVDEVLKALDKGTKGALDKDGLGVIASNLNFRPKLKPYAAVKRD